MAYKIRFSYAYIPGLLFAALCCLLLLLDIVHVLHGVTAAHFRSPIFAMLPFPVPYRNPDLITSVPVSELTFVFPFGSPSEILLVSLWFLLSMCFGFWGLAELLGKHLRQKGGIILAVLISLCLFAVRFTLLNTQTSFLLTALMYILCVTNVLGSIYIYRGERSVLQTEMRSLTRTKAVLLIDYGIFIVLLLTAILLFRYHIVIPQG